MWERTGGGGNAPLLGSLFTSPQRNPWNTTPASREPPALGGGVGGSPRPGETPLHAQ